MIRSTCQASSRSKVDPVRRAGVVRALVALLDRSQGMEGLGDRDADRPGSLDRCQAGHPEVGVGHVGRALGRQSCSSQRPNSGMKGSSSSFGTGRGGPAGTCTTVTPGARGPARRGTRRPAACRRDLVAALPEVPGQGVDVHVLASGINATEHRQRDWRARR